MTAKFHSPQSTVVGHAQVRVTATLRNGGDTHWSRGGDIRLGYQVLDPDTGVLIEDSGRAELPADLAPGGEVSVEMTVQFPDDDGVYLALISPVEENVAWFHDRGSDALILEA
jgi:hypothetical protein